MEIIKNSLRRPNECSKPPVKLSNDLKLQVKDTSRRTRCRTSSITNLSFDSRPVSTSPSRGMVPLNLVSTSNVKMPIDLQKKLLSQSRQRKALVGLINCNEFEFKKPKIAEKLNTHDSKENLRNQSVKECTFGSFAGNQENNYVNIYYRQKKIRDRSKHSHDGILRCIDSLKCVKPGNFKPEPSLNKLDSNELEARYQKITNKLERMSKNIQTVINNSSC